MKESILKEILKEYELIRHEEEEALEKREREVIEKIPEIAEIRQAIVELMAQRSREIIQHPQKSLEAIRSLQRQIAALKARQGQLLSENGFSLDYLSPRYRCKRCKDTGYVGFPVREKCKCLIQKLLARTYQLSNFHELDKQNFDTFDPLIFPDTPFEDGKMTQREYMLQLKDRLEKYTAEFPGNKRKTLLFTGKTGLGKTFLLNCMAKAILDRGYTVVGISAYKLFDQLFESALRSHDENRYLQQRLFEVDVLIIDDLGTETQRNNFTSEDLFNILNERYLLGKHTFLSTNLGLKELRERYSDRITSRLFDTSNTIILRFRGQDVRLRPLKQS